MASIKHQINIDAPAGIIYEFITSTDGIQQWLPKTEGWLITGQKNLGGILFFHFGPDHHEMKISKLDPNKEVRWECIAGHPEWVGTTVDFKIEDKGYKSILYFE